MSTNEDNLVHDITVSFYVKGERYWSCQMVTVPRVGEWVDFNLKHKKETVSGCVEDVAWHIGNKEDTNEVSITFDASTIVVWPLNDQPS